MPVMQECLYYAGAKQILFFLALLTLQLEHA